MSRNLKHNNDNETNSDIYNDDHNEYVYEYDTDDDGEETSELNFDY